MNCFDKQVKEKTQPLHSIVDRKNNDYRLNVYKCQCRGFVFKFSVKNHQTKNMSDSCLNKDKQKTLLNVTSAATEKNGTSALEWVKSVCPKKVIVSINKRICSILFIN